MTDRMNALAGIAKVASRLSDPEYAAAGADLLAALEDQARRRQLAHALRYDMPSRHARRDGLFRELADSLDCLVAKDHCGQARRIERALKRYRRTAWKRDRLQPANRYRPRSPRHCLFEILRCVDSEVSYERLRKILAGQN